MACFLANRAKKVVQANLRHPQDALADGDDNGDLCESGQSADLESWEAAGQLPRIRCLVGVKLGLNEDELMTLRIMTALVYHGVMADMLLACLGELVVRNDYHDPPELWSYIRARKARATSSAGKRRKDQLPW